VLTHLTARLGCRRGFAALALAAASFATLPACLDGAADGDKGEEEALPEDDGAADTQRTPTDHGVIGFAAPAASELTTAARYHAWEFALSGPASIDAFTTYAIRGQRKTDTVLYLYKQQPGGGFGAYIARNDDHDGKVYSRITRSLEAGTYRVLVKGYAPTTLGKFKVEVDCAGAGCVAAPAPDACVFGSTYGELDAQAAVVVSPRPVWTAATVPSAPERARPPGAGPASAPPRRPPPGGAFARVDQGEINAVFLYEPAAARTFVALEYGAGDNSYGAFFAGRTATLVARIHDGDLEACTVHAQTCLLGATYFEMRTNPGYSVLATRVVTDADTLAGVEEDQALLALREAYGDAIASNAEGIARADDHQLNIITYLRTGTGARLHAFGFGAGHNSYGAVFYGDTVAMAAAINDGDFYECSFFMER